MAKTKLPKQYSGVIARNVRSLKKHQGSGLGSQFLLDAYHRAANAADVIGARALVVDPLDEKARSFYINKGFEQIDATERLFARF